MCVVTRPSSPLTLSLASIGRDGVTGEGTRSFGFESSQGKHASQGQSHALHGTPGPIPPRSREASCLHLPRIPGCKIQASPSREQHAIPQGGKPGRERMGRTHPSNEYLLVFGMSMMSMKPLFPAKGRGGGYRAASRQAEQQTMGQHFFIGDGNSVTRKAPVT